MNKKEMAALVAEKDLSPLPERERVILESFYLRDETLAEVSKALDCAQARISQLRFIALYRLHLPVPRENSRALYGGVWRVPDNHDAKTRR